MSVQLGQKVRCVVSGLEGVVIGRTEFLNGCMRIGVQPRVDKDGKVVECAWIDEPQLEVVEETPVIKSTRATGGPMISTPTRASDPT